MKRISAAVLALLCVAVSLYASIAYSLLPLGALLHPAMKASFEAHAFAVRLHIFASIVALLVGPLQFSAHFRGRRPTWHRRFGRAYLALGVGLGGVSGLYISQFAFGGLPARSGFAALALAWLATGWLAYRSIRRGDRPNHRRWMSFNFSLTLAAVTLRLYLAIAFALGIEFELAYPVIAWLCWLPNLALVQWWMTGERKRPRPLDTPVVLAPGAD